MSGRVAVTAGLLFALIATLVAIEWSPLMDLDNDAVGPTTDLSRDHDLYRRLMTGATWALNSQLMLLYLVPLGVLLVRAGRAGAALWLAVTLTTGTVLNPILKQIFGRERPTVESPIDHFSSLSFPSGHANSAALMAAALTVVFWRGWEGRTRTLAVVLVVATPLLSGWTRLTLGGHYLSDVVGGMLLGVTWVALWQPALPVWEQRYARAERADRRRARRDALLRRRRP